MKLKLLVGLSGNEYSLAPGDEHDFDAAEAGRLIDAGIAVTAEADEPAPATPAPKKKAKANVVSPEGGDATN